MSVMSELHDVAITNAPEGAQYYALEDDNFNAGWYKQEGDVWYFFKHCEVYPHQWRGCTRPISRQLAKIQTPFMSRWLEQAPKQLTVTTGN